MKKIYSLAIIALLFACAPAMAQVIDDDENNRNEIVVTDEQGEVQVIDLPEGMTYELDSLLELYHSQTYMDTDNQCDFPDVNPTYSKEEYIDRLSRLPSVIEMPYNEVVRKFIDKYSGQLRRSISYMLGAQNFYMPIFEQALEAYSLPLELKYLPVIESALNPKAVSRVGATGLWQFMLATGKRYGLAVTSLVDERCDPIKSSYAAAHYLSDLYRIFGDWNLVIAAYNAGPENINKAIHRAKGKRDYWQIYPYLPRETRGYVPAFIAANYIMNYYCEHNICPIATDLPTRSDTIVVERDVHFEQIAHVLGMDINEIKELNPQYRRNIVNGSNRPSAIRLPINYINSFIDNEEEIFAYDAENLLTKRAEVEVNNAAPSYQPARKSYSKSSSSRHKQKSSKSKRGKKAKKSKKGSNKSVTVRKGDTLSSIAKRNGTTVEKLKKLNKIKGSTIRSGKKIKVK